MMRLVLSFVITAVLLFSPAHAQKACDGCTAAKEAQKRSVIGKGKPDPKSVCFYVLSPEPSQAIAVDIFHGESKSGTVTFPEGAAQEMSGDADHPMICIRANLLAGATEAKVIPGRTRFCGSLKEGHIEQILKVRSVPMHMPVCLAETHEQCMTLKRSW